jgi:hypothetical protein
MLAALIVAARHAPPASADQDSDRAITQPHLTGLDEPHSITLLLARWAALDQGERVTNPAEYNHLKREKRIDARVI